MGFRRACAGLLLPRPLSACQSPLRLFTDWFLLAVVVSSWKNLAWLFSWRLRLGTGFFPWPVIGTVIPVVPFHFFRPFYVPPAVTVFTLRKALRLRNIPFFFSLLPRFSACGVWLLLCWLVFLLVGVVASSCGGFRGVSRSSSSAGGFSPIQESWVPGYLVSLALALSSYYLWVVIPARYPSLGLVVFCPSG